MSDSSPNPHSEDMRPQKRQDDAGLETALRPQRLSDFVGQQEFLERIQIAIEAARRRGEPLQHVLLYGPPGLGKTTMARIIANEMGVGFRQYQGSSLDRKDTLAAILTEVNLGDVGQPQHKQRRSVRRNDRLFWNRVSNLWPDSLRMGKVYREWQQKRHGG